MNEESAPTKTAPTNDATGDEPPTTTRSLFWTVFPSIMLPMFLAVADQTIVATALPNIAADLGEVERISWVVVSYLIANTIAAPVYGRLGNSFGRRRMILMALALFIAGSVACAFAPTITLLTAARVLQGFRRRRTYELVTGARRRDHSAARARPLSRLPRWSIGRFQYIRTGRRRLSHASVRLASIFLVNVPLGLAAVVTGVAAQERSPATGAGRNSMRRAWCCSRCSSARSSWLSNRRSVWTPAHCR